jgi:hypothetical protein
MNKKQMENKYEDRTIKLNELSEGDEFIGKWSPTKIRYLKNLGGDRHLLKDVETGREWEVPHGRFPSFKKITTFINEPIETILEKPDLNSWKYYSKLLSLSEKIYLEMFGEPKSHTEWADSFNKIGRINRLIIKHANGN